MTTDERDATAQGTAEPWEVRHWNPAHDETEWIVIPVSAEKLGWPSYIARFPYTRREQAERMVAAHNDDVERRVSEVEATTRVLQTALDSKDQRLAALREALEFYAKDEHYEDDQGGLNPEDPSDVVPPTIFNDHGEVARAALASPGTAEGAQLCGECGYTRESSLHWQGGSIEHHDFVPAPTTAPPEGDA